MITPHGFGAVEEPVTLTRARLINGCSVLRLCRDIRLMRAFRRLHLSAGGRAGERPARSIE